MNTIRFFKLLIAAFVVTIVSLMLIYPPPKSISLSNLSSGLEADIEEPSNYGDESIKSRYNDKIGPILEKQSKFKKKKFMKSQKNIPIYSKNVVSETSEKSPTCGYEVCRPSLCLIIKIISQWLIFMHLSCVIVSLFIKFGMEDLPSFQARIN